MAGLYNPNPEKGFDMKKLGDSQVEEYKYLKRLATRYALLGLIGCPIGIIILAIKGKWWYAAAVFTIACYAILLCAWYDLQARAIAQEEARPHE